MRPLGLWQHCECIPNVSRPPISTATSNIAVGVYSLLGEGGLSRHLRCHAVGSVTVPIVRAM